MYALQSECLWNLLYSCAEYIVSCSIKDYMGPQSAIKAGGDALLVCSPDSLITLASMLTVLTCNTVTRKANPTTCQRCNQQILNARSLTELELT